MGFVPEVKYLVSCILYYEIGLVTLFIGGGGRGVNSTNGKEVTSVNSPKHCINIMAT